MNFLHQRIASTRDQMKVMDPFVYFPLGFFCVLFFLYFFFFHTLSAEGGAGIYHEMDKYL